MRTGRHYPRPLVSFERIDRRLASACSHACNEAIYDAHYSKDRSRQFFHSSSYTANPIACAAALANLAIWRDEPVIERIQNLERVQKKGLERLSKALNSRQLGTITACEICESKSDYLSTRAPELLRHFTEHDVLVRPLGNTIYVMPPYCIGTDDLDQIYDFDRGCARALLNPLACDLSEHFQGRALTRSFSLPMTKKWFCGCIL